MPTPRHSDGLSGSAWILTGDALERVDAKTAHGIIRDSDRFNITGVIDGSSQSIRTVEEIVPHTPAGIPVYPDIPTAVASGQSARIAIVGVATHGGVLAGSVRDQVLDVLTAPGIRTVISGLHALLTDDPDIAHQAAEHGVRLHDVRRPRPFVDLRFYTGEVLTLPTPRVAVLGTDCQVGKRTTARLLYHACRKCGITTEVIATGQTGWLQGTEYGFVLDATPTDFVAGELEREIVRCARERDPDLILIEGQGSSLVPSGSAGGARVPVVAGGAAWAIFQHMPSRIRFKGMEHADRAPDLDQEIEVARLMGAMVIGIALNGTGMTAREQTTEVERLERRYGVPVVRPFEDGVVPLVETIRAHVLRQRRT